MSDIYNNTIINADETIDNSIIMPAGKLDADDYQADDLDGVTESMFGSGNMGYASLQASQSDAILEQNSNTNNIDDASNNSASNNSQLLSSDSINEAPTSDVVKPNDDRQDTGFVNADRIQNDGNTDQNATSPQDNGQYSAATVGAASASQLSSGAGSFSGAGSGLQLDEATTLDVSEDIIQPTIDENLPNTDPHTIEAHSAHTTSSDNSAADDFTSPDNITENYNIDYTSNINTDVTIIIDAVTNVINTIDTISSNIINLAVTTNVDVDSSISITHDAATTIINTVQTSISNIITDITQTTESLASIASHTTIGTDVISTISVTVHDTVSEIIESTLATTQQLQSYLTQIDDLANELPAAQIITEQLTELIDIATNVADLVNVILLDAEIDQDIFSADLADLNSQVTTLTESVSTAVDDIIPIATAPLSPLLNTESNADNDIVINNDISAFDSTLATADIDTTLNFIEDIVGDVDVTIDTSNTLLNPHAFDDADSDVTLATDIDIIDHDISSNDIDLSLDPAETVIGDIDVDAVIAANVLGEQADPLVDNANGGSEHDDTIINSSVPNEITAPIHVDTSPAEIAITDIIVEANDQIGTNNISGITDNTIINVNVDAITENTSNNTTDNDLNIDLTSNVLNISVIDAAANPDINAIEDITGDIDTSATINSDALSNNNTETTDNNSDVVTVVDLDIADHDIASIQHDISIDVVEPVTGDLDTEIIASADVLGSQADPALDEGAGGSSDTSSLAINAPENSDVLYDEGFNNTEQIEIIDAGDIQTSHITETPPSSIADDIISTLNDVNDSTVDLLLNTQDTITHHDSGSDAEYTIEDISDTSVTLNADISTALTLLDDSSTQQSCADSNDIGWTESTVTDGGGLFGDMTHGDNSPALDALPDPSGTVAEGLGALSVDPDNSITDSGSGGLFG